MSYYNAEFDPNKMLKRLKRFHKAYCDLYGNGPLIGCSLNGVHIEREYAEQFAPIEAWEVTERHDETFPYEITTRVDGLRLYAVGTAKQLERFLSKH